MSRKERKPLPAEQPCRHFWAIVIIDHFSTAFISLHNCVLELTSLLIKALKSSSLIMAPFGWILTAFILTGISAIILPYLWYLFWKLRHHFLIKARFTKLTLSMSIVMFITDLFATMNLYTLSKYDFNRETARTRALNYPITVIATMTLSFLFCAAIVYRAFLIFDKWSNQEIALQNQSSIIVGGLGTESETVTIDILRTSDKETKNKSKKSRFLKYVVISTLAISSPLYLYTIPALTNPDLKLQRQLIPIPFLMVIILGIFVLIKSRKMRESMSCKKETYMLASVVLLNIVQENLAVGYHVNFVVGGILGMLIFFPLAVYDINLLR